jgi:hypothetical protein
LFKLNFKTMEKHTNNFFNRNLVFGILIGAALAGTVGAIFFDYFTPIFGDINKCETDNAIYLDWSANYDPNNFYALKVSDFDYREGKRIYDTTIPQPPLAGAYGGTIEVEFLTSFLCQATKEGATEISFNIAQPPGQAAKVMLFSNATNGSKLTRKVMTIACPPNCRDKGDTMSQ